jgi:hypothetical protein
VSNSNFGVVWTSEKLMDDIQLPENNDRFLTSN